MALFFDMVETQLDVVGAFPSVGSENGSTRGLFIGCPKGLTLPRPGMVLGLGNVQGLVQAGFN